MDTDILVNHKLKLSTFNCKSVKRSVDSVRSLCDTSDVVALQETWLLPHDLPYLCAVHKDFACTGTSAVDTGAGVLRGRPYGGVALLWRKSAFSTVSVVKCNNRRLCAIKCKIRELTMLIFSVYMPTDCTDNLPDFTDCLSEINAVIEDSGIGIVFMLGDFNAHPGELFFKEMQQFCTEQKWLCADYDFMQNNGESYTYISDAHGCTRWLDHCLVTNMAKGYIDNISIRKDVSWSDHYPLEITCNLKPISPCVDTLKGTINNKIIWGQRDGNQNMFFTKIRICFFEIKKGMSSDGTNMWGHCTRGLVCASGNGLMQDHEEQIKMDMLATAQLQAHFPRDYYCEGAGQFARYTIE
ncbi:uncharacterized protein [Epargyreus clarus]|uniref:uncharacterized protein n=1 Tax=Epargyreus clarus TaxID=520877 RepID=UPI003C2FCAB4